MFKIFKKNKKKLNPDPFEFIKGLDLDIIFDVGAYQGGISSKLLNYSCNAKVFAFEPFSPSFQILKKKLGENSRFKCFQIALSDKEGKLDFYSNNFDETNSLLPSENLEDEISKLTKTKGLVKVETQTIDKFCKIQNLDKIDFLKIDVQGNTYQVLQGAKGLLENKKIKIIFAEVEFLPIYKGQILFSEIEIFLRSYGFHLYDISNVNKNNKGRFAWADALFILE
ncbi:methyltransferase, FkbM family [Algoriphagus ornithinivorans]|uniref:Methyltransferase, FkbM family n=1 Tax=Algoriphagus ornithinivorans TaxID=226506 RepID=A0A1I5HJB9_9BACT|nr:FkbM family methyltransferase [Algoriphagus ornithinivorans]SFO48036.1 methyltransferase, FkbM family [Algoriphagus ornithinivorans]